MNKMFWGKKIAGMVVLGTLAVLLFGWIVMSLWNMALVAAIPMLHTVTFTQALGILVLSKILFGGFRSGGGGWKRRREWGQKMKEKWNTMTPEEQEKFKQEWRQKCGRWGRPSQQPERNEEQAM